MWGELLTYIPALQVGCFPELCWLLPTENSSGQTLVRGAATSEWASSLTLPTVTSLPALVGPWALRMSHSHPPTAPQYASTHTHNVFKCRNRASCWELLVISLRLFCQLCFLFYALQLCLSEQVYVFAIYTFLWYDCILFEPYACVCVMVLYIKHIEDHYNHFHQQREIICGKSSVFSIGMHSTS